MLEVFQENASFGLSFPGAQQSISFQSVLDQARDKQVETIRVEREVVESELKGNNPDMLAVFTSAAASGHLDEQAISEESLGRVFGPLQAQVKESVERQERLIAQIQKRCCLTKLFAQLWNTVFPPPLAGAVGWTD